MYVIDDKIVSDDVVNVKFNCHLHACHGDCCVEGDEGAPLEEDEIGQLEDALDEVAPYMTKKGLEKVDNMGVFDYGAEGDYVTPLINDRECAFVYFENDISLCAIEKAYREGKTSFMKPISCHLYPIRITKHPDYDAVNYHKWAICKPALKEGKKQGKYIYQSLEEPLVRKYGQSWYSKFVAEIKLRDKENQDQHE